jgi:hypothetical protein
MLLFMIRIFLPLYQQDDESSPVLAPKQKDQPKDEPVDNSPAKPTPSSGHARSTPPASKSKQKRKAGGDDAKTSGGTASKKVKVESVSKLCSLYIFKNPNHKFHRHVCSSLEVLK